MIRLEQAFYGRDSQKGYRLLASSAAVHNAAIENLCSSIGTPDGFSIVEPFYINYISGDERFMVAGCTGNPDEAGRKTLFFHIFIGKHQELLNANFGISALIKNQAFQKQYTSGPVLPVTLEESNFSLPWGKTDIVWNGEKLAIASNKPELELLTGILKNQFNTTSWASLTFNALNNFPLYVISQYSILPSDRKTISKSGELLSSTVNKKNNSPQINCEPDLKPRSSCNYYKIIALVSVLLNIVLFFMWIGGKNSQSTDQLRSVAPAQHVDKPKVAVVAKPVAVSPVVEKTVSTLSRADVIKELRQKLEQNLQRNNYRRFDGTWEENIKQRENLFLCYNKDQKSGEVLRKAGIYIDFVNSFIFKNKEN